MLFAPSVKNRFNLIAEQLVRQNLLMNCRPSAILLFAFVGLVPMTQAAIAGKPTSRQATATATILPAVTNDLSKHQARKIIGKYIGIDGHVTTIQNLQSRPIIIIDLP